MGLDVYKSPLRMSTYSRDYEVPRRTSMAMNPNSTDFNDCTPSQSYRVSVLTVQLPVFVLRV